MLALPILALLLSLVGASHKSCYLSVLEQFLLLSQRWTKVNKQWLNAIVSRRFLFGWKDHGTGDVQALSDPTTTRPSPPPPLRTCSDPTLPSEVQLLRGADRGSVDGQSRAREPHIPPPTLPLHKVSQVFKWRSNLGLQVAARTADQLGKGTGALVKHLLPRLLGSWQSPEGGGVLLLRLDQLDRAPEEEVLDRNRGEPGAGGSLVRGWLECEDLSQPQRVKLPPSAALQPCLLFHLP